MVSLWLSGRDGNLLSGRGGILPLVSGNPPLVSGDLSLMSGDDHLSFSGDTEHKLFGDEKFFCCSSMTFLLHPYAI